MNPALLYGDPYSRGPCVNLRFDFSAEGRGWMSRKRMVYVLVALCGVAITVLPAVVADLGFASTHVPATTRLVTATQAATSPSPTGLPMPTLAPPKPTSTSLNVAPNPALATEPVTLTATVSPVPDGGTVAFANGSNAIGGCGAVPVNTTTGVANCTTTGLPVGSDSLTATYGGDGSLGHYAASRPSTAVLELVRPDTLQNLINLLFQDIRASAAYRALPPIDRQAILAEAELFAEAPPVMREPMVVLSPGLQQTVAELRAERFLTSAQAGTLDGLIDHLQR